MASIAQIEAARRNGARSKGPSTDKGRARSSQNSLKHGLSAKHVFVLANETEGSFVELMREFQREHDPRTTLENELVVELTFAWWRIRRLHSIETGLFDKTMAAQASTLAQRHGADADEFRLAEAFEALTGGSDALRTLSQYESRLFGMFNRILNRLAALRAERANQPAECKNEPEDAAPFTTVAADAPRGNETENDTPPAEPEPDSRCKNEPKPVSDCQSKAPLRHGQDQGSVTLSCECTKHPDCCIKCMKADLMDRSGP